MNSSVDLCFFCGHLQKLPHFRRWPQKNTDLSNISGICSFLYFCGPIAVGLSGERLQYRPAYKKHYFGVRLKTLSRAATIAGGICHKKLKYLSHLAALSKRAASGPTLARTPLPTSFKGVLWSPVQLDEAAYRTIFFTYRADSTTVSQLLQGLNRTAKKSGFRINIEAFVERENGKESNNGGIRIGHAPA